MPVVTTTARSAIAALLLVTDTNLDHHGLEPAPALRAPGGAYARWHADGATLRARRDALADAYSLLVLEQTGETLGDVYEILRHARSDVAVLGAATLADLAGRS